LYISCTSSRFDCESHSDRDITTNTNSCCGMCFCQNCLNRRIIHFRPTICSSKWESKLLGDLTSANPFLSFLPRLTCIMADDSTEPKKVYKHFNIPGPDADKEFDTLVKQPLLDFLKERKYKSFHLQLTHLGFDKETAFPAVMVMASDMNDEYAKALQTWFDSLKCTVIKRLCCYVMSSSW